MFVVRWLRRLVLQSRAAVRHSASCLLGWTLQSALTRLILSMTNVILHAVAVLLLRCPRRHTEQGCSTEGYDVKPCSAPPLRSVSRLEQER